MENSGTLNDYWIDSKGTAHEKCKLLFFAGKDYLGESDFDPGNAPELGYRRGSVAYFCPSCGEIWGRVVRFDGDRPTVRSSEVVEVSCERHSDQWEVAGSFLSGYRNEGFLRYLPREALVREFMIHLLKMEE